MKSSVGAPLGQLWVVGGTGLAIPTDVADPMSVGAAAERAEAELGPIDVWVNDAMTTVISYFDDIEPEE